MKARHTRPTSPRQLVAFVDGDVTPSEAAAIERECARSPEQQARVESLKNITGALGNPIVELESMDLRAPVLAAIAKRERRDVGQAPPAGLLASLRARLSALRGPTWVGLGAAATAAVLVLLGTRLTTTVDPAPAEVRAKSASRLPAAAPQRWAGISVFRVAGDRKPERVQGSFSRTDGLLFTYTNLGAHPYRYLMIFAVDASGEVRWFHPAYERADTNPSSIAIETNAEVPLTEVVRHPFAPGAVTLQALFSNRPLRVADVEAWLARRPRAEDPAPWPDTYRHVVATAVEGPR